ncbi:hypothetical protein JCM33374_g6683 [Metschnikowia sp. JCM 33374]|nr:hypothetical protein JCM33374_g6683 [Metschnikowia sp. JCM 33374]
MERTSSEKMTLWETQLMAEFTQGNYAGLLRIVEKVRESSRRTIQTKAILNEVKIRRLISGYGIGSEKIINKWYKDESSGGKVDTFGIYVHSEQWQENLSKDKSDVRSAERRTKRITRSCKRSKLS